LPGCTGTRIWKYRASSADHWPPNVKERFGPGFFWRLPFAQWARLFNPVVQMSNGTPKLSVDDIAKLLSPLIDTSTCDRTSLTNLARNRKAIISKLNQTGCPVLLVVDGQTLLLCNAHIYTEVEKQRRCVLSRLRTKGDAISIGKVVMADPRISELAQLKHQIFLLELKIKNSTWGLEQSKNGLAGARARANTLVAALKNRATS
jgi:hypothetical protein